VALVSARTCTSGNWGVGLDLASVDRTRAIAWSGSFSETDVRGWWVRCEPFELVVPATDRPGPTIWLFQAIDRSTRPRESLDEFANTAVFHYRASSTHFEGTEEKEALAADGLRLFAKEILEHLRDLP
jgi:hypothetical protein